MRSRLTCIKTGCTLALPGGTRHAADLHLTVDGDIVADINPLDSPDEPDVFFSTVSSNRPKSEAYPDSYREVRPTDFDAVSVKTALKLDLILINPELEPMLSRLREV